MLLLLMTQLSLLQRRQVYKLHLVYSCLVKTFHHHLSGEGAFYPAETGIVHVSSVTDPAVKRSDMADAHRHLVDPNDRLGSIQQLQSLIADGYQGPVSFEPFSEAVQRLNDHKTHVLRSIEFIRSQLCDIAA